MQGHRKLMTICAAAVLTLGLAACGGGGDDDDQTMMQCPDGQIGTYPNCMVPDPEPTPAEQQMALITSALGGLDTALMGLDADSPTVTQINAVDAAIGLLQDALTGAVDLSPNETAEARGRLMTAETTVATARSTHSDALALEGRRTTQMEAISEERVALGAAIEALMADDAASITEVNAAITALQGAVNAAADLSDGEKMAANSDLRNAEVSAATAELAMYTAAAGADGASDEDMLAAYEGKLAAATRLVAALTANDGSAADIAAANQVIGSATSTIATLEDKIRTAKKEEDDKERLKNNAAAEQVAKAINAHGVAGDPPVEFLLRDTTNNPAATGDTNFGITRTSGAAVIKLTQSAADAKSKGFSTGSAPTVEYYPGTTFSRSGMSGKRPFTEMAAIYTDIEEAGPVDWVGADLDGMAAVVPPTGIVSFDESDESVAAHRITGILPAKPSPDTPTTTTTNTIGDGTTNTAAILLPGTFYGVSGTYTCAATSTCTVVRNTRDQITITGLTFTPSAPVAGLKAKYADPDTDYTYFGYWMRSTELRAGTMTHDVETFHDGMGLLSGATADNTTTANLTPVLGTATYYGGAAGVYVKRDGAGDSLRVSNGEFTADAMLTARFGGSTIAENKQFQVEGTISDFMAGGNNLGFADLALNAANLDRATPTDATSARNGAFSGETDGGGTSGNWSGQFYGNAGATTTAVLPNGNAAESDDYPINVSGEFNGHFVNGHVAGAFGAERDE